MKNYKKSLRLLTPLLLGEREGKTSLCSCSCCAESKVFQSLSALLMRKKSFSLKLVTLLPFPFFPSLFSWMEHHGATGGERKNMNVCAEECLCGKRTTGKGLPFKIPLLVPYE